MNIKPCPFCGELPEVETWSRGVAVVHRDCRAGIDSFSDSPNGDGFGSYGKDEKSAIEAWNTRAERTCAVCKVEGYWRGALTREWELSCGHMLIWAHGQQPSYCPYCGAKVVE